MNGLIPSDFNVNVKLDPDSLQNLVIAIAVIIVMILIAVVIAKYA